MRYACLQRTSFCPGFERYTVYTVFNCMKLSQELIYHENIGHGILLFAPENAFENNVYTRAAILSGEPSLYPKSPQTGREETVNYLMHPRGPGFLYYDYFFRNIQGHKIIFIMLFVFLVKSFAMPMYQQIVCDFWEACDSMCAHMDFEIHQTVPACLLNSAKIVYY